MKRPQLSHQFAAIAVLSAGLAAGTAAQDAKAPTVHGIVVSGAGPLSGVNIFDMETLAGSVSRVDGRFDFALAGVRPSVHIVARRIGYSPVDTTIVLPADSICIEMRALMVLMPITVQAGRYTATAERTTTLTPVEVANTPGSNADITGAIKTLPGVQNADEGTGLFVRGGDFTETRIFIDGAPLFTAYQFEAPTGSVAGTINPFLTSSIAFSSGGFGVQWGNALSGVVDLRTLSRPARTYVNVNASILNVTAGAGVALPHKVGLTATLGASDLTKMLAVNGNPRGFEPAPHGRTASGLVAWDYRRTGSVKVFGLLQKNGFGIVVDDPAFSGIFRHARSSDVLVASWRDSIGRWVPFASLSTSGFSRDESKGAFDQHTSLRSTQLRLELPIALGARVKLTTGGEVERIAANYTGTLPAHTYDPASDAPRSTSSLHTNAVRDAAFASIDVRPSSSTELVAGLRSDHSQFATRRVADPRVSFAWMPRDAVTFTAAYGTYHQVADPAFLDRLSTDDVLPELRSTMAIAGVQVGEGTRMVRFEGWSKRYNDLVGLTRSYQTAAGLDGRAHGMDFFARSPMPGGINARLTYSGSVSKRTDPNTGMLARAAFDVTHSLTLIVQKDWASGWSAGAAARYATGRPFTDVVGASADATRDVFVPQYGAPFAERLPQFTRTDISISKQKPFGVNRFAVAFIGINNVFNLTNTFAYTWTSDYAQRLRVRSAINRTFFIGANLVLVAPQ